MAAVGQSRTLPWSWYSDPAVLALEQERIFAGSWQYAGHTQEVVQPGSFATTRIGHLPVVLVRDRDGELRAFLNVCRHRGALVCDGNGRRETLQCPYHAWTYGLDGALLAAPRADHEPGFDRSDLGLIPLQIDTWGPFVFVNPDPAAGPLADALGELPQLLADDGIALDAVVFHTRAATEYDANWKVCAENYLECYHCSVAHPSFAKAIDVAVDSYALDVRPGLLSQFGAPRDSGGGIYDAAGEIERGQFHFLYPNTTVNVMPGRPNVSIGPIIPLGPDRTYRHLDYFFAPDVDAAWIDDYMALDDQVGAEDRALVERVHAGMRAGAVDHGVLLPASERLIAEFQTLVAGALAGT